MTWQSEYPFCSHRLAINGADYHYVDEGNGQPLLMVHGNPTWSFYWRHLISEFKSDFRAIAPDHIGCGLSDQPQDYDYTLANRINDLVTLIDHLDLTNITLFAHDWGGAIGMGAAVERPERFSRFVLLNTAAFPPPIFPWRIRVCRFPLLGQFALQALNLFSLSALKMAAHDASKLSHNFKQGIVAPYDSWNNRIAVYRFVKDIPASPQHPTWKTLKQIESALPQFQDRPVHLIWGMKDWCFRPQCMERFVEIFPHADVHKIENAGHWVVEEAKEEVSSIVRGILSAEDGDATSEAATSIRSQS